ncbi:uncharacterized protein LOC142962422 [Anarhichas minor]|uniref:uncharacterized protein LOC142962422 n=1 Tax=Anarhichas minor TaxID=65739 RepID=UPI003F7417DB
MLPVTGGSLCHAAARSRGGDDQAAARDLASGSHCGAAAVDRPGAVFQGQLGEVSAHRRAEPVVRLQLACPQPLCTGTLTKAGLYRTIRRVLDIDGWYLMATEYLECRRCKKKVGGWSQITSTFGSILKMDSTKKVTKKLAGTASDTAAWVTNVGNEHGQVLMSVLTCSEGSEGLSRMAAGLTRRYQHAGVPPPQLIYVNRDCCNRDGLSRTAAVFPAWGQLVVRLDIWHLMRRFASGVTTESHKLWTPEMPAVKRSELEGKHGMVDLTDVEVTERISKKEWRLHCRRRTRGAEETSLLIQELLDTFGGAAGRDTLDIPLLDALCIQDIWSTQRRHLSCIQDPPGMQLYTETGRLTKGGVSLPVYRCARGTTSLESFHLHLNRFIPGTRASAKHFQAFLVDGLVRWNEDRAAAAAPPPPVAAEGQVGPLYSYSGHLKHVLNQKSQRLLGLQVVKDFTKPAEYTGELIGVEYLYQQTGRVLEDVSLDPDTPDEAAAIESLEEEDEGIVEDVEDPTIFEPDTPSTSTAAARSGDPADASSEPSGPAAPDQDALPEAPEVKDPVPPSSERIYRVLMTSLGTSTS